MSRKRFIKLMMSLGYSRNTAAALAVQVSRYGSYAAMYQKIGITGITSISTLARTLPDVIRGFYIGLAALGDALATAFSNFAESMRRAANE